MVLLPTSLRTQYKEVSQGTKPQGPGMQSSKDCRRALTSHHKVLTYTRYKTSFSTPQIASIVVSGGRPLMTAITRLMSREYERLKSRDDERLI